MAVESINDQGPKNEQLNKIQRKKVLFLIEQNIGNPESALTAVRNYCMGLSKITVRCVTYDKNENPSEIHVNTSNTTYYFKLKFDKKRELTQA